ncbi:hypothetical protein E2C01_035863 [Portunus trituberculatus]|uniref:Uncharacterized protein n=1 Tax=Portunus trituberculatus TaxID=210409 RepID=A0A5B7FAB5_PORTR|nr:hypothetical protein [Portunus trituberculatus]
MLRSVTDGNTSSSVAPRRVQREVAALVGAVGRTDNPDGGLSEITGMESGSEEDLTASFCGFASAQSGPCSTNITVGHHAGMIPTQALVLVSSHPVSLSGQPPHSPVAVAPVLIRTAINKRATKANYVCFLRDTKNITLETPQKQDRGRDCGCRRRTQFTPKGLLVAGE